MVGLLHVPAPIRRRLDAVEDLHEVAEQGELIPRLEAGLAHVGGGGAAHIDQQIDPVVEVPVQILHQTVAAVVEVRIALRARLADVAGVGRMHVVDRGLVQAAGELELAVGDDARQLAEVALAGALSVVRADGGSVGGAEALLVGGGQVAGAMHIPEEGAAGEGLVVDDVVQAVEQHRPDDGVGAHAAGHGAEGRRAGHVLVNPGHDGGDAARGLADVGGFRLGAGQEAPAFGFAGLGVQGEAEAVRPAHHGRAHFGAPLQVQGGEHGPLGAAAAVLQVNQRGVPITVVRPGQVAAHPVGDEGQHRLEPLRVAPVRHHLRQLGALRTFPAFGAGGQHFAGFRVNGFQRHGADAEVTGGNGALLVVGAGLLAAVANPIVGHPTALGGDWFALLDIEGGAGVQRVRNGADLHETLQVGEERRRRFGDGLRFRLLHRRLLGGAVAGRQRRQQHRRQQEFAKLRAWVSLAANVSVARAFAQVHQAAPQRGFASIISHCVSPSHSVSSPPRNPGGASAPCPRWLS